ncbi:YpgQ [Stagonosporopsis vannaccii]|nr:YpgQ [Stagonosporopsis vannaccii]
MPGLESMRRRLSSIAKTSPEPTSPPSHTHPDTRLLDPDYFNMDAEDLTWFHKVNLAVRRDTATLSHATNYMHVQRVTVSAWSLFQAEASAPWARDIDPRTVVVGAMVASLGAPKYVEERERVRARDGPCDGPAQPLQSPAVMQHVEDDLLFGFLRHLDCPPDVAGPSALIASLVCFERETRDREMVREQCEAYPALRFVQDAVRLDELGCVGIARLGARKQGTLLEMVHRMDARLVHYAGLMKTKAGRKEAERRWVQMLEFREGLLGQMDCSVGLEAVRKG